MNRKRLLLSAALLTVCRLLAGDLGDMPADWAAAKNYLVPYTDGKRVFIRDFRGNDLLELTRVCLAHPCIDEAKDDYWAYDAKVKSAVQLDPNIVRVEYENTRPEDFKEHYALIVSDGGPRMHIENRVVVRKGGRRIGTASGRSVQFSTIGLKPAGNTKIPWNYARGGIWTKPEQGESYEASGATLIPYEVSDGGLFLWCDTLGEHRDHLYDETFCLRYRPMDVKEALRDMFLTAENAKGSIMPATGEYYAQLHGKKAAIPEVTEPMSEPAKEDRAYSNTINLYYLPWKGGAFVAAAMQTRAALAATVSTGKDFNLFDSSKETAAFEVTMMNPKDAPKENVTCRVIARNYDGKEDINETFKINLKPYEIVRHHFTLPKRTRDYWFVNVEFDDGTTNSFIRADIATIEPYKYKSLSTSIMGIAASFDIPSVEACDKLLTRMGARWIRTGNAKEAAKYALTKGRSGILSFHLAHDATNETQRLAFAKEKLKEAAALHCPIMEIGNELNFGAFGDEAIRRATEYGTWLKSFYTARAALKLDKKIKISTFGFAGCTDNCGFYKAMAQVGCWQYCDILSLHPGRLNQTPDNPGCDWQWNYLPQIQSTKGFMRELREKTGKSLDLILTEVYARTPPNFNDSDSTRSSAENVVLSCALAKIEAVTALNWYQMHDSVHTDIGNINEFNTEYHYGLLRRDGTVKPALLAFCTISEALDGAEFRREIKYDDDRKAWEFTTPQGPMVVIYDRKDGYFPYGGMFTDRPFTGHLEPWLDHWKSHTEYRYEAPKGGVIVRDAIGRTKKIKADSQGYVTLTLSGSPLIVYGLGSPAPADAGKKPIEWGLVTADEATPEEVNKFHDLGGSFVFDRKLDSDFVEYEYFTLPETVKPEHEAAAEMKDLYARGVRRMVIPLKAESQETDWKAKYEATKQQGLSFGARLAPYAAAHKAEPAATPEVWVLPLGDKWAAMLNGVNKLADGVAFLWKASFPWESPYSCLNELSFEAKGFELPYMILNYGSVGYQITWKDNGHEQEIADTQFFTALLMLNLQSKCRAIALTNLRDANSDAKVVGSSGLAATLTEFVDGYAPKSGLFDKNGGEKSRLKAANFVRELTRKGSAIECIVSPSGLRTLRFWDGKCRCAVVWLGNRNSLTQERIDDLSGKPEPTELALDAVAAKKKPAPKVYDMYGAPVDAVAHGSKVTFKLKGVAPLIIRGLEDIKERQP